MLQVALIDLREDSRDTGVLQTRCRRYAARRADPDSAWLAHGY